MKNHSQRLDTLRRGVTALLIFTVGFSQLGYVGVALAEEESAPAPDAGGVVSSGGEEYYFNGILQVLDSKSEQTSSEAAKQEKSSESIQGNSENISGGEESMSMAMAGSGSSDITGGADGSANTLKQVIPDADKTTGALTFGFPLDLPPGRNGIEPSLSLNYNSLSSDPNSIFGPGWSLNIPQIKRVAKKGINKLYTAPPTDYSDDTSLISYWRMEGSSTDTKSNNNGTDTNLSYGTSTGKFGQGMDFSYGTPVGSRIGITGMPTSSSMTVMGWVNPLTNGNAGSGSDTDFDGTIFYGFYPYFRAGFKAGSTRTLRFEVKSATTWYVVDDTTTLTTGAWAHVAFVHDGSTGKDRIYINGQLKQEANSFTGAFTTYDNANYRNGIGGRYYNGTTPASNFWYGAIDDLAIFSRVLSTDEVSNVYSGGSDLYSSLLGTQDYYESSLSGELVPVGNATTSYVARVHEGDFLNYAFSSSTWTVTDKAGRTYTFGNSTSTRQSDPASSTKTFAWALNEVRDLNGNYMTYEYYSDKGQLYPAKIYYTQYGTTTTPFEIEFLRESRPDVFFTVNMGFNATSSYRIKELTAKHDGALVKKYAFGYATSTTETRRLLDTIAESGNDGSATTTLPATNFDYQGAVNAGLTSDFVSSPASYPIQCPADIVSTDSVILADVSHDGLVDMVGSTSYRHTGVYNDASTWTADSRYNSPLSFIAADNSDEGVRVIDLNGDGWADMMKRKNSSSTLYFGSSSGWALHTNAATWVIPVDLITASGTDAGVRVVDLNGDSLPDIIKTTTSTPLSTQVWMNDGTGWGLDSSWTSPVQLQEGTVMGDFNGDGLIDLIRDHTYLNNGKTGWQQVSEFTPPAGFGSQFREADINGDGYSDLIWSQYLVTQNVYLNTGSGFATSSFSYGFSLLNTDGSDATFRLADYTGDGIVDVLKCQQGVGNYDLFYKNTSKRADLLSKVTSPLGGSTNIAYKATPNFITGTSTLSNPELAFIIDAVETISKTDGVSPTSTQTFAYQGGKQYFASAYDRKMAGFQKMTATDTTGNKNIFYFHQGDTSSSTIGEYNDEFSKIGKIYRTEVTDSSGNVYSKSINKWDSVASSTSYFVNLLQNVSFAYDGDSDHKEKAESYSYSTSTGNLLTKNEWGEVSGSDDGTFSDSGNDKYTTTLTYATATSTPSLSLLASVSTVDTNSTKVQESRTYYDSLGLNAASTGNPTKQESWVVSSTYVSSTKAYNALGMLTSATDPRGKTTTFGYEAYNLYFSTSTNPLSQVTDYLYDYTAGKPKQVIDPNGLVSQVVFDGVDRITEEKQPDLTTPSSLVTKKTYTYTYQSPVGIQIKESNYLDGSNIVDRYTYTDGFGRTIQTRQEAEGSYGVSDTVYNNIGQVYKQSLPYFNAGSTSTSATSDATLYIANVYDPLYRITATGNAIGTTTMAYDDWKTTITDPLSTPKVLYKDAYDNLKQVDETISTSTLTTVYEYNYLKNLTKITDALSNVRNFTYDGLGRRLTAQDLHASGDGSYGTYTYAYDDAGNLTQQIDPNSQTVNFTYDDVGRPLTEDYTGAAGTEYTYFYDTGTYGIGHLYSASSSAALETNTYNGLGLVATSTKTISSTAYATNYSYDRQGNVLETINPDLSRVKNTYGTGGQIETIQRKESTDGGYADVVTDFAYGPHGKVTEIYYANGTVTTNTYDAAKMYRLTHKVTLLPDEESMMSSLSGFLESFVADEEREQPTSPDFVITPKMVPTASSTKSSAPQQEFDFEAASSSSSTALMVPSVGKSWMAGFISEANRLLFVGFSGVEQFVARQFSALIAYASGSPVELYNTSLADDSHLIAYWRMEQNSNDAEGSSHGTDSSMSYSTSSGKFNYGAAFASGSYITGSISQPTSAYTISGWFTHGSSATDNNEGIWDTQQNGNYGTGVTYVYNPSMNKFRLYHNNGSWVNSNDLGSYFEDGAKHHVAVTWTGATSTFYVDGVATSTSAYSTAISNWGSYNIGQRTTSNQPYVGNMDDLAVFSRALSATEISDLYNGDLASSSTPPSSIELYLGSLYTDNNKVTYLRFNGDANDAWGNNNGTGYNASYSTTTYKFTQSLSLSGTGGVKFGNSGMPASSSMTVSAWLKPTDNGTNGGSPDTDFDSVIYYGFYPYFRAGFKSGSPRNLRFETKSGTVTPGYGSNDTWYITDATSSIPVSSWSHVAFVHDGTDGTDSIYVNGQRVRYATTFRGGFSTYDDANYRNGVGARYYNSTNPVSNFSKGNIDDFAVFSRALSSQEISDLYSGSTASSSNPLAIQDLTYDYDANNNITRIIDVSNSNTYKTVDYTYDTLNRLLTASSTAAATSTNYKYTYQYDGIGNMTSGTPSGYYLYTTSTTGYVNPHAAINIAGTVYAYDTNGNLTSDGTWTHTWDYRNRLSQSTKTGATTTYGYDHTDMRVKLVTASTTTIIPFPTYSTENGIAAKYINANGQLIATLRGTGTSTVAYYMHPDHLGSQEKTTDDSAAVVELSDYYPYLGVRQTSGTIDDRKGVLGKDYDNDTGLNQFEARYYKSAAGRFISQDPAFLAAGDANRFKGETNEDFIAYLSDPQRLNSYSYARNNPIANSDPNGKLDKNTYEQHPYQSVFAQTYFNTFGFIFGKVLLGRDFSYSLYSYSASLSPSDLYITSQNQVQYGNPIDQIQQSSEYQNVLQKAIKKYQAGNGDTSSGPIEFASGDLYSSLHGASIAVNIKDQNGTLTANTTLTDKYDFNPTNPQTIKGTITRLPATISYGYQQGGYFSNYGINIQFTQPIKPSPSKPTNAKKK